MPHGWNGLTIIIAVAVLAVVASTTTAEAARVSMKLGHIRADTSPTRKAALKFAELVAQKTGGEIEIKAFPNGQLGGILDMFTG